MGRYKIGEIVKNVGISSFSLKHYEKKGLLRPKTDEQSGYRYYDVPDLGELLWIHQMRNWNFTVKEIKRFQDAPAWDESIRMMEKKIQENEALAARLLQANRCLVNRIRWAQQARDLPNRWELAHIPPFDFLEHCRADELEPEAPLDTIKEWVQEQIATYMGVRIPRDKLSSHSPRDAFWGFLLFDHDKEGLPPRKTPEVRRFPGGECLVYYYSQPVASHLNPDFAAPAVEALGAEGASLLGDIYGLYLSETLRDSVRYENYVLLLPIKKD